MGKEFVIGRMHPETYKEFASMFGYTEENLPGSIKLPFLKDIVEIDKPVRYILHIPDESVEKGKIFLSTGEELLFYRSSL